MYIADEVRLTSNEIVIRLGRVSENAVVVFDQARRGQAV
jgi:hypothetical protein